MRARLRLGFFAAAVLPVAVPTPPPNDDFNRPVVYSVAGMDRVRVRPDLVYTKNPSPPQKMDVYLPETVAPGKSIPACS